MESKYKIMFVELSKAKRQVIAGLAQKKMRQKYGLFAIEGRKSVEDILFRYPERFKVRYIAATPLWLDEFADECIQRCEISPENIFGISMKDMHGITSLSTPADVVAVCEIPEVRMPSLPLAEGLYLMLDGIQDPGNLGTIVRTAHWFGIDTIFASPGTADIFNPKTIQAAMGSMAAVEVIYTDLPELKRVNFQLPVVGLMLDGENIFKAGLPRSAFILMGNEGNGVSREMRELIDLQLTIPPHNPVRHSESINVAIATAITLGQFRR